MIAEAKELQHRLLTAQNSDGGWGYQSGVSWTEPTALAVLALAACGGAGKPYFLGRGWLARTQRRDGGWSPNPNIETSTWVTSLSVLALCDDGLDSSKLRFAVEWILKQTSAESGVIGRFMLRALGLRPVNAAGGWPWYPGTASWIAPSVASVLALAHAAKPDWPDLQSLRSAIRRAQRYILSRRCRDGGWNHGGSFYRSEDAESYPEMTGMALLALRGIAGEQLEIALDVAENSLTRVQSSEAVSWLQLGLMVHGRSLPRTINVLPCRTIRDVSLRALAMAGPVSENKLLMPDLRS